MLVVLVPRFTITQKSDTFYFSQLLVGTQKVKKIVTILCISTIIIQNVTKGNGKTLSHIT